MTDVRFKIPTGEAMPGPLASGGRNGWVARSSTGGACGSLSLGADSASASGATGAGSLLGTAWTRGGAGASGSTSTLGSFGDSGACPCPRRRRSSSAISSSRELEWVFLSATPSSGNSSRRTFGFTSSSRASSLMRILLIEDAPAELLCARVSAIKPFFSQTSSGLSGFRRFHFLYPNRFTFRLCR